MKLLKLALLITVLAFVLFGCTTKEMTAPKDTGNNTRSIVVGGDVKPMAVTYPLTAGQTIDVGNMVVSNDDNFLYIQYNTTGGWMLMECQAHVGSTLADISDAEGDALPPGQMDYQMSFNPYVTTYTFTIPLNLYGFVPGSTVYWVAHCTVILPDGQGGGQQETGFGGNQEGSGHRWWFWDTYTIEQFTPPGDDEYQYETAMMRMYDISNDYTYRWRKNNGKFHPWFGYVKTYPGVEPQTYYFYAGKSHKCGEVDIWKEGDFLKVEITMMNDWIIDETHLKVSLTDFIGPPAFGLFPYNMTFDPAVDAYTYTVPWDPAWDGMQLNIALHAAVKLPIPE